MTAIAAVRPPGFECPWCGPGGVAVDVSLPPALRVCDACAEADLAVRWCPELPPGHADRWGAYMGCGVDPVLAAAEAAREVKRASLREILVGALRDFGRRWEGCEFAKAWMGEAILGAMDSWGMDRGAELERALAALTPTEAGALRVHVRVIDGPVREAPRPRRGRRTKAAV